MIFTLEFLPTFTAWKVTRIRVNWLKSTNYKNHKIINATTKLISPSFILGCHARQGQIKVHVMVSVALSETVRLASYINIFKSWPIATLWELAIFLLFCNGTDHHDYHSQISHNTVNQLILTAIKVGGWTTFWMIIEVFPYIILFNFCPNAKSAKLNSTPNLVDLQ